MTKLAEARAKAKRIQRFPPPPYGCGSGLAAQETRTALPQSPFVSGLRGSVSAGPTTRERAFPHAPT